MKYGLIGENVKYSYSKYIHELLFNEEYELFSISQDKINETLNSDFVGLNITIPYKPVAYKKADILSLEAHQTGVVNALIKRENKIYGYNFDIYGFAYLLKANKVNITNKKCLILGTGATSNTVEYVLKSNNAKSITKLSRNPDGIKSLGYNDTSILDSEIIINATPVGKYPNNDKLLDLSKFSNAETYIDVIYSPYRTSQAINALDNNIKAISGLEMFVAQAIKTNKEFQNQPCTKEFVDKIYQKTRFNMTSIFLIGHPFSGKTTIGKELAKKLKLKFLDVDELIEKKEGKTIPEIFEENGEEYFRELERKTIEEISGYKGYVIATGGGSILNKTSMDLIRQNGIVINLSRNEKLINNLDGRPLVESKIQLRTLINERKELYLKYADINVCNNYTIKETINSIRSKL